MDKAGHKKKAATSDQYNKLIEVLTWLEPEELANLLEEYEFDVTKKIKVCSFEIRPMMTIPYAYDWYIGYPIPWSDKELGEDLHNRNERIKRILEGHYSIDYNAIDESDQPDAILNMFNDRAEFETLENHIEDYNDYGDLDLKDIELHYYGEVYNLKKVVELLSQGANPRTKFDDEDVMDTIQTRMDLDEIELPTVWKDKKLDWTDVLLGDTIKWSVINRIIRICEESTNH